jgi:hypothetical protein
MLKLFRIQPCANNKSGGIYLPELNKIGFAFFRFFYDFICNLQETGKSLLLLEFTFCSRDPGKKFLFAMWSLAAGQRLSGQIPANRRPGTGGGGSLGPWGPIPVLARGGEEVGEGRRRRPGTVAEAACCTGAVGLYG